ncbi:MAG: methyltransferase family protein [Bacteroidetes bacterium]|nr:MAG: methyltransferase family protein [Bacteroidota bacterium]
MQSKDIANFYDDYTSKQKKTGVNARHRTILKRLKRFGLEPNHRVLEIGCGIGTVTGLLAAYLEKGQVVGVDISPKSVELARKNLSKFGNAEFVVSDMSSFSHSSKFDVVLLPDVLEHIPVDQHANLFRVIRENIHENSFVAINLPNPYYLDWIRVNKPELLQIIDQSIYTNLLLPNVYASDMFLFHLESYSLFSNESNYQWIILKPNRPYHPGQPDKISLAIENFKTRIG